MPFELPSDSYRRAYSQKFEKQLKEFKKKDKHNFERLKKRTNKIVRMPKRFDHLKYEDLKCNRHDHMDPFVIVFSIEEEVVKFHFVDHHDNL